MMLNRKIWEILWAENYNFVIIKKSPNGDAGWLSQPLSVFLFSEQI